MTERNVVEGNAVLAVAALAVTALDIEWAPAGVLVLVFLLVGPGLAFSFVVGRMRRAARALVSVAASIAAATVVATGLALADAWSGVAAVAILAVFTQACVVYVTLTRPQPTPTTHADPAPIQRDEP